MRCRSQARRPGRPCCGSTPPRCRPWPRPGCWGTALRWRPRAPATTVRVRDGQVLLTDGPAAELREQVGGYTIIDCPDLDDALQWAPAMAAAPDCSVDG